MRRACLAHYQWPRALRGQRRGHWMDCRNSDRDTAALPPALRRITVWWRCNQDRSLVVRLTFTCDRVFNRNLYPHCSRVSVRRAAQLFKHASVTLRIAKRLQDWRLSFLEFIACGCGLVFSFRHDTTL